MVQELVEITVREKGAAATSRQIKKVGRTSKIASKSVKLLTGAMLALTAALSIRALANFAKSSVKAAASFESFGTRLRALLGSQTEANLALETFVTLAAKTPFAVSEIVEGASTLAAAALGNRERLEELTQTAANLAAVTGLSFREAAGNLQRSLAAGIGAADLFRERGVRALIESIGGIPDATKLSGEELDRAFKQVFGADGGVFGQAAEALSLTLAGALSNVGDAATNFKVAFGDAFSPTVVNAARDVFIPFFQSLQASVLANSEDINDFAAGALRNMISGFVTATRAVLALLEAFGTIRKFTRDLIGAFLNLRLEIALADAATFRFLNKTGLFGPEVAATIKELEAAQESLDRYAAGAREADADQEKFVKGLNEINEGLATLTRLTAGANLARAIPTFEGGPTGADLTKGGVAGGLSAEERAEIARQEKIRVASLEDLLSVQRDMRLEVLKETDERGAALFLIDEEIARIQQLGALSGENAIAEALINELIIERNRILAESAEKEGAFADFTKTIGVALREGIQGGFEDGEDFASAFADSLEQQANQKLTEGLDVALTNLETAMNEVFESVADGLGDVFGDSFDGLGSALGDVLAGTLQFVALQAASALFGGGGNRERSAVGADAASAVTSTQAVRGIVAGPQSIAIAQVPRAIAEANEPLLEEAIRQTALQTGMLAALTIGGASSGLSDEGALAFTSPVPGS